MTTTSFEILSKKGTFDQNNANKQDLVSALMVTRGDIELIKKSLRIFISQTWRNKELCVVTANHQNEKRIKTLLESAEISYQFKIASNDLSLGNLRNISMSIASGTYVCTWDDDDLYASSRISIMMEAIRQSNTVASFLKQVLLYYPDKNKLAISHSMIWENSMLVRRSCSPVYQDITGGEDSKFVRNLMQHHEIALVNAPGQYAYVRTGTNTVGENHFNNLFKRAQKTFDSAEINEILSSAPCFAALRSQKP